MHERDNLKVAVTGAQPLWDSVLLSIKTCETQNPSEDQPVSLGDLTFPWEQLGYTRKHLPCFRAAADAEQAARLLSLLKRSDHQGIKGWRLTSPCSLMVSRSAHPASPAVQPGSVDSASSAPSADELETQTVKGSS